jgi:hypothetical protein
MSGADWDRLVPGISDPEQWCEERNERDPKFIASEARRLVAQIDERKRQKWRTVTGDTASMDDWPQDNCDDLVQQMTYRKDEE